MEFAAVLSNLTNPNSTFPTLVDGNNIATCPLVAFPTIILSDIDAV